MQLINRIKQRTVNKKKPDTKNPLKGGSLGEPDQYMIRFWNKVMKMIGYWVCSSVATNDQTHQEGLIQQKEVLFIELIYI